MVSEISRVKVTKESAFRTYVHFTRLNRGFEDGKPLCVCFLFPW